MAGRLATVTGLVYLMATAETGPVDPTESGASQSHASVVLNSSLIVFRQGIGGRAHLRRRLGEPARHQSPEATADGSRRLWYAVAASVPTWFVLQAVLDAASPLGPKLEAITGFIAVVVLLVVLNSFVHKIYWSDWIGRRHRQRLKALSRTGLAATIGLIALGFTTVYREGFEVVSILQNLELQSGAATVLEGVAIGLAGTPAPYGRPLPSARLRVPKPPYKRILVEPVSWWRSS